MPRRYHQPPIIEALCEFRFRPTPQWDLTIPGLFYDRIKDQFPNKRQQPRSFEFKLEGAPPFGAPDLTIESRLQFFTEEGRTLIQLDRDLLSVNQLNPYSSWEHLLPLIRRGYDAYFDVARPAGLQRIGLRYINQIVIPEETVNLHDYFTFYPIAPDSFPRTLDGFLLVADFAFAGQRDTLRVRLTSAQTPQADTNTLVLDLDYFTEKPDDLTFESVFPWIEQAHANIENSFEAIITDNLRRLFQPEDS